MSLRFHFILLLVVVSAMAQTFQYSRGWTNGRKRSEPTFVQQPTHHLNSEIVSNSAEDWSRSKANDEPNEDGERLVYGNHCAKLVSLLDSILKNNDIKSDEPVINLH